MNLWIARHDYCSSYDWVSMQQCAVSSWVGASCFIVETPRLSVTESHHEQVVTRRLQLISLQD